LIAAQTKDIAIDDQFTAMAARAGKLKAVELD